MTNALKPYRQNLAELIQRADIIEEICGHIANGGDLITWAEANGVRYSDLTVWLNTSKERARQYNAALVARDEWLLQKLMVELKQIGESDLRQIFNDSGSLKDPKDWPDSVARSVMSVEVEDLFAGSGKDREHVGFTKKVKLWPKIEAIKLQLQKLGVLIERKQVLHTFDVATRMNELEEARRRAREAMDVTPKPAALPEPQKEVA